MPEPQIAPEPLTAQVPKLPRADARARLVFKAGKNGAETSSLLQQAPLRVLFPYPAQGDITTAAITNTSGGLVGGDRLAVELIAEKGARILACQQAAEKVYRSAGQSSLVDVSITAEDGAWAEWLPQETILFEGSDLRRCNVINMAPGSTVLAGEMLVFGREAHGESLTSVVLKETWEVRRAGRLVWADILELGEDVSAVLAHPAGLAGARASATVVFAGPDNGNKPGEDLLVAVRTLARDRSVRFGASMVNGILVMRWLGENVAAMREDFGSTWELVRSKAGNLPPRLPRFWRV
ncbi:MAG: urease accessory protein UreD [Magnetovibrionaceae bacterium]